MEPTPGLYVQHIVEVFREVRRVLRQDGTVWLNMGDSYASGNRTWRAPDWKNPARSMEYRPPTPRGLKPKDLIGVPWRVAFALQSAGWYLRSDIIWSKSNPIPESVADRCTKAHEYLFLLTKSAQYYYDADAIREPAMDKGRENGPGRNKRSVWTIPTARFPDAHFATFPPGLVKPCVLAGSRPGDVVLDPFIGSGTTAMVARDLGRHGWGIDANAAYLDMAARRIGAVIPLLPVETE